MRARQHITLVGAGIPGAFNPQLDALDNIRSAIVEQLGTPTTPNVRKGSAYLARRVFRKVISFSVRRSRY